MFKNMNIYLRRAFTDFVKPKNQWKKPVTVAITGDNGKLGYAAAFKVASGQMLGPDQPIDLHIIDLPNFIDGLKGVAMELHDCNFPLLNKVEIASDLSAGFKNADYALLIGAKAQSPGEERGHLLEANGKIFIDVGKALNDNAKRDVKVVVVGNPANTNCLIANHFAPDLSKENFTALTRLDHNRGISLFAEKMKAEILDIENFAIWGNHGPTMYPDLTNITIKGEKVYDHLDHKWRTEEFIPRIRRRWAEIQEYRGWTSVESAAHAAITHMRDWTYGTNGFWTSMAIVSEGQYGIEKGLVFSYPVICSDGKWKVCEGLKLSEEAEKLIRISEKELIYERDIVSKWLK
jgi:malate dehydrogenase